MDNGSGINKDKKAIEFSGYCNNAIQKDVSSALCKYLKENEFFTIVGLQSVCSIGYSVAKRIRESLLRMGIILEFIPGKGHPIVKEKVDT